MLGRVDGHGQRKDKGKLPLDLTPSDVLVALAEVSAFGARKYNARNWERGMPWSKVYGPLLRHINDFARGKRVDPESRLRTSAHLLWNAMALCAYDIRGLDHLDDLEPFLRKPRRNRRR